MSRKPTLDDLLELHDQIEEMLTGPLPVWLGGLSCVGLGMTPRSRSNALRYEATPDNCAPFADTGGGGCHFSFLQLDDVALDDSPIVLTVPSNQGNWIVGSNLWDFLSLGCNVGYFGLEQLEYNKALTLREYINDGDSPCGEPHEVEVLNILTSRYALEPWRDRERIADLQKQFAGRLVLE